MNDCMMKTLMMTVLAFGAAVEATAAANDAAKPVVTVDLGKRTGEVRPGLHSAAWRVPQTYGKTAQFKLMRDLHLKAWRSHDAPADEESQRVIDTHFIFPLMHLDPSNPSNYYFKATDNLLRRVIQGEGRKVFYRLGTTIEHLDDRDAVNTVPPADPNHYAEVLAGIVRHYNCGWANGYKWNIRYWELFNEPNIHDCWRGTREQFITLFVTCLKRLKSEFGNSIKVGGPAFAWFDRDYTVALFDACKKAGVMPDFYSWHHYGNDPAALIAQPAQVKKFFEERGYPKMELVINEWHYLRNGDWSGLSSSDPAVVYDQNQGPGGQSNIDSAAYTLAVETGFQDTCLDQSFFYGFGWRWTAWGCWDPFARKLNKVYYAMKIMGELVSQGRWKLAAESTQKGVSAFAVQSADSRRALVAIADYKSGAREITLNLKRAERYRLVRASRLDYRHDLEPFEATLEPTGRIVLKKDDALSACYLLELEVARGLTPEMPPAKYANFHARDLTPVKGEVKKPGTLDVVVDGKAVMSIVYSPKNDRHAVKRRAAEFLANCIFEMTGVRPRVVCDDPKRPVDVAPAFYVGEVSAVKRHQILAAAGLAEPLPTARIADEEFVVAPRNGSYWFLGRGDLGVYDFCDRILGVRQYWLEKDGGRFTPKTQGLRVPQVEWRDKPVFAMRNNYPWAGTQWGQYLKDCNGGPVLRYPLLHVHPSGYLKKELNFKTRYPDIFQLDADGKRGGPLCYGNPRTLAAYEELIDWSVKRGESCDIVDIKAKSVTVSQWDCDVHCYCDFCKKLFDPKKAPTGDASPCIWGFFVKNLSEWMAKNYPDWDIVILPYINTCDCPEGLTFPHRNVTAMLCTMPGMAMLKNPATQKHEEDLIRAWAKATGRRVENWHYSCWPAEFTCAPYVYGSVCQGHYQRLRGEVLGSFLNGGCPLERFGLTLSAWMKSLWNPDFDLKAFYDEYATRMFGPAAKPARRIVDMMEKGWCRPWANNQCSNKNIYEVSYPRKEVEEVERLFAEAEKLVKDGDPAWAQRLAFWKSGFKQFFEESADHANGTGFEPLYMKKVGEQPKIDGILDEPAWATATPRPFVAAYQKAKVTGGVPREAIREDATPIDGGEMRAVWTPQGVTFGWTCREHAIEHFQNKAGLASFANESFDIFLDPSGEGEDAVYQLVLDARGAMKPFRDDSAPAWKPEGAKLAWHVDAAKKCWSCEFYLPYSCLKGFKGMKQPTTSANGVVWSGNVTRWRVGDSRLPKGQRPKGAYWEATRLWTRSNWWNKDPTAFGKFVFVE